MASPKEQTFGAGPFKRVRTTSNPYDDFAPDTLADASNCYLADPQFGGGIYARPGITRWGPVSSSANKGQAVYCHTALDGTNYNFFFINGKVYRQDTDLSTTPVDVTPLNVTISPTARIYVTSLADQIVVNDGVNVPWLGSSLEVVPITATVIERAPTQGPHLEFDGAFDTAIHVSAVNILFNGVFSAAASTPSGIALPAGTIPADQWGCFRVSINSAGTFAVTAAAANFTTGYATEAAAIAAVPATPVGGWNIGYFTVQTAVGQPFIDGTDGLAGGSSGNVANATNYYEGAPPPWTAFGQPVIYTGSVFFILSETTEDAISTNVHARTTITWSEPNQPNVGYQQTDYDNAWTLTQTSTEPLYALAATNDALYYFRQLSIGAVTGAPNINFQNTATHDVVSANVGCTAPATVQTFLNYVYFVDARGRPQRLPVGGVPEPIWRQAQSYFEGSDRSRYVPFSYWAVLEPNLNVYLLAYGFTAASLAFFVFDAVTGIYMGQWSSETQSAPGWEAGGIMRDANGVPQFVTVTPVNSGNHYLWKWARVGDAVWTDNADAVTAIVTTGYLGYNARRGYTIPETRAVAALHGSGTAPALTVAYSTSQQNVTPASMFSVASAPFGPYRLTHQPANLMGRHVQLTIRSQATSAQLKLYRIEVDMVEQGTSPLTDW